MKRDTQGPIGNGVAVQPTATGSPQSSRPSDGPVTSRRLDVARRTDALARWSGPTPVRRGARGLFVTRWRWMALVTLVVVAGAALLSWSRTPTYRAAADVLVQPRLYAAGTPPQVPDMGSEKAAAASTVVLEIASQSLGVPADRLSHGLSVSVPLNTHVLHIAYASTDARQSQQRAQAIAAAYASYWLAQQPPIDPGTKAGPATAGILKTAVITPATRPTAPASPNHLVDIGIALIIGLLLAVGTAYLRDRLDDRLRGPDEFEENGGGPVLALVPAADRVRGDLVVTRSPGSPGAEAYRELRTLLLRVSAQRGAKSLLVTSPTGDAQTAVSANVAVTLAQAGRRVVLVHADLRRPHGHELFGIDEAPGLADVLEGRASLTEVLRQPEIPGPQILPAGLLTSDVGTALHASPLRQVLQRLSTSADIVVIDAPPVLAGADIATMVELADMVLMVGDALRTTRAQVRAAAGQLAHVREKLIGCVLDNFGRRARLVTPPLSLVTGRDDHADTRTMPDDGDAGQRLPSGVDVATSAPSGPEHANGRETPATTGR
jgi:polysaccharide biosynthesis transport protein